MCDLGRVRKEEKGIMGRLIYLSQPNEDVGFPIGISTTDTDWAWKGSLEFSPVLGMVFLFSLVQVQQLGSGSKIPGYFSKTFLSNRYSNRSMIGFTTKST